MADQTIPTIKNLRGNIGIGTASPVAKLHIEGDKSYSLGYLDATSDLHIGNDTMSSAVGAYAGSISFGSTNESNLQAASIVAIQTDTDQNEIGLAFFTQHSNFGSSDLVESMRITNDGKVGINKTSPAQKLHIKGDALRIEESASITGRHLDIVPAVSGQPHKFTSTTTGSGYQFENSSGTIAILDANGSAFYQDLTISASNLKLSSAHYVQFGSANARIQGSNGSNYLKFYTGGTERLAITNTEATFSGDISIPVAKKLYFGGGSHTYISEDIDDRLRFFTGGAEFMRFTEDTSDTINFYKDATFAGDVTINGTTTTINSTTLQVDDKNIELGTVDNPTDLTAHGGGITLKGDEDYTINWHNSGYWEFNQGITVGENGTGHDVVFYGDTSDRYLTWDQSADKLHLRDSVKLTLGTHNDLQLSHDGVHGHVLYGGPNNLQISGNSVILIGYNDGSTYGETAMTMTKNGAVTIRHDNSTKFTTTAGGVDITGALGVSTNLNVSGYGTLAGLDINGNSQFDGAVTVGVDDTGHDVKFFGATSGRYGMWDQAGNRFKVSDSAEYVAGAGNDLKLYHNGTNSYLKNTTGDLYIKTEVNDGDIRFESDDGSGNEAEYFRLDGGDVRTIFSKDVRFLNNVEVGVGTSKALSFAYNGANSYISNLYGDLYIDQHNDNADIRFNCDDGSGGITEYFRIDGGANQNVFPVSVLLNDGVYLHIGTGSDLQLYHDATNSNINNNTGDLHILNTADDKDILLRADDGSGGNATYIQLDGSVTRNKLLQHTSLPDGKNLILGAGDDLMLYHNGTNSYIQNDTGDFRIEQRADDGDMEFYSDNGSGGIAKYFHLDGGEALTIFSYNTRHNDNVIARWGTGNDLNIYHDGSSSIISNATGHLDIKNDANDADIRFFCDDGSNGLTTYLALDGSDAITRTYVNFRAQDNIKFQVGSGADAYWKHDGTNTSLQNDTGDFYITNTADNKDIIFQCDDTSGGTTPYFRLDGDSGYTKAHKEIRMDDSIPLRIGTGGDARFMHDGNNTYLDNYTGHFYIRQAAADKDIVFKADDGSGGNETYFYLDGSKSTGDPYTIFPNNSFLGFGNAGNLLIRHTGLGASIQNNGGDISITQNTNDGDIRFYCDDGSGGTAEYFRLDGSVGYMQASKALRFADNVNAQWGASADLVLRHNGTSSYIENYTGNLDIKQHADNSDIIFYSDDGSGGSAEYFRVDGDWEGTQFSKSTRHFDSVSAYFGSSGDLQILHDGTNSSIKNETGNLTFVQNADDKDIVFKCDNGSGGNETYFYLDGSASSGDPYTKFPDNSILGIGDSADLKIFHNATNTFIENNTGDLFIKNGANDKDILFQCDDGSGGTETYFYLDGSLSSGSPFTIFPDNSRLGIGESADLYFVHDGTDSGINNTTGDLYITNHADDKDIVFRSDDGSGGFETYFFLDGSASSGEPFTVFPDNSQIAFGDSRDLRIDHNGTDSFVQNYVGNLVFRNYADDKDIEFHCDNGSGGTETYFFLDGSVSSGNPITKFPDNSILALGTSGDFYHYHDGTNSYHANFTGDFYIDNNANDKDVILRSDDGSGGVTAYITLDGSATDIKFSKNVDASSQNIVAYYLEGTYKSFLIDHPTQEGKKLRHGCLEGPEHGVYFRGKSSDSIIECPEYWMGLVEEDSVTVQLTAIGPNQNIYVDHIDEDGNIHVGSNTDEPLNYYYTVNGERKGDKVVVVEDA